MKLDILRSLTNLYQSNLGPSPEKASRICGNAARTSGHHGCFDTGSSEETKQRKKTDLGSSGNSRRAGESGSLKVVAMGIVVDFGVWR